MTYEECLAEREKLRNRSQHIKVGFVLKHPRQLMPGDTLTTPWFDIVATHSPIYVTGI